MLSLKTRRVVTDYNNANGTDEW